MTKDNKNLYDVIVIGGGPAGLTAALYLARSCYRVLVLEKEKLGGQITLTSEVVNYPGIPKTDGDALTGAMHRQAESFGAEFKIAEVTGVDLDGDIKKVQTSNGEYEAFGVIIASGASPRKLGFKGEAEFTGHGVAYCATCDGEFFTGKDVFVIGGGFAAAEEGIYLTKFAKSVTILMRGDDFSCAKSIADEAKNNPKITIKNNSVVQEVAGDSLLRKLVYKNTKTGELTTYETSENDTFGVFSFAGYVPATAVFKDKVELSQQGYVITDESKKTNVDGVYAAGDVCEKNLRQVVTAVGDGGIAATELEKYCTKMREETGIVPQMKKPKEAAEAEQRTASSAGSPGSESSDLFSAEMLTQLNAVFSKMENPLILSVAVDERNVSAELLTYMTELAKLTDKLELQKDSSDVSANELPRVRILRKDGSYTGLAYHGVPGGHEFTSFILGIYNASGSGQKIDEAIAERIKNINEKKDIKIIVSLTCTMCPELVTSAQKIASLNENVTAEIYDVMNFPDLREKYNIMSVPCMVINDGTAMFGKKNIEQLLEII